MYVLVLLFFKEIHGCRCKIEIKQFGIDAENSCSIKKYKNMGKKTKQLNLL